LGLLVGELAGFVDLCAYGALVFIRMPMKMSVSTLTSCKRTITAPIGRLLVGCVAPVYHSLVYDDFVYRYANIGKFARVWCIDGMFFEAEGEKSGCCRCFGVVVFLIVQRGLGEDKGAFQ
jgi:hypothetical protein